MDRRHRDASSDATLASPVTAKDRTEGMSRDAIRSTHADITSASAGQRRNFVIVRVAAPTQKSGPYPSMGGARERFPGDFGWPLWMVYVVWFVVVGLMYPCCAWYGRVKRRHRGAWWTGYV